MDRFTRIFMQRSTWRGAAIGLACALVVWLLKNVPLVEGLDRWTLDHRFQMRGPRETSAKIVLIAIDDESLDEIRKPMLSISPEFAKIVASLKDWGAAAVGIDVIIPESLSSFGEVQEGAPGDATTLGMAIMEADNVVLAMHLQESGNWNMPLFQWRYKRLLGLGKDTDLASVNLNEDEDQFVRRQQLGFTRERPEDGQTVLESHFALALYEVAHPGSVEWKDGRVWIDGVLVPWDEEQKIIINYVGPPRALPRVAFKDVLKAIDEKTDPPIDFKDAIVVLGATAESLLDFHSVPYSNHYLTFRSARHARLMAGPEIHLNTIATLHDRAFIVSPWWLPAPLLLGVTGVLLGMALMRLNLEGGALLTLAYLLAWYVVCIAAFNLLSWRLEMASMFLLGFVAYSVTFATRWRKLRRMMGVVKSEAIAKAIEADPKKFTQAGEERNVSVLFSDIRSFTTYSEGHQPQEVVKLLNRYFSEIVPIIESHGGTIDKYMGDGIMVIFGAPQSLDGKDPLLAAQTGVKMVERVHALADTWEKLGFPGMRIGVGVHTGKVIVGSVGSKSRLDYTAIGDTVNAASRIESENKPLGTEVLISEATYSALTPEERVSLNCSDTPMPSQLKGKHEQLNLYELKVGPSTSSSNGHPQVGSN